MVDETKGAAACLNCQTRMELLRKKKYPGRWPTVLIVTGIFCCLFLIGAMVGIPMLLLGIYMATAKETINHCPNCGHYYKVWMGEELSG